MCHVAKQKFQQQISVGMGNLIVEANYQELFDIEAKCLKEDYSINI